MRDPVTGFDYPEEWVTRCKDPKKLGEVEAGLSVLTSTGQVLRRGFTTGTTAAAACKAAILSLQGDVDSVDVRLPCGLSVEVPAVGRKGVGRCAKFSGDYPSDVTSGLVFVAMANPTSVIAIQPGRGIGRFSRDTPRGFKGTAAISPPARGEITLAIREAARAIGAPGASVHLEAEGGERIGPRTLNPRVGVEGGISVLGTTGLVEPWDDHLEESNLERIAGADRVVLTTGRMGLRFSRLAFPDHEIVLVGAKMEKAIAAARGEAILAGLPALILKFLDPEILAGSGYSTVEELMTSSEGTGRMSEALSKGKQRYPDLRVVLFDRHGSVVGDSG